MSSMHVESLQSNPEGKEFIPGQRHNTYRPPELLRDEAAYWETFAHSGQLKNPEDALAQANKLREQAAKLEAVQQLTGY